MLINCGENPSPTTLPVYIPLYTNARLRDLSPTGTHLLIILFIAGIATPSPIPIHARAMSNAGSPIAAAMGVITVASDHQMTPNPSTTFPP